MGDHPQAAANVVVLVVVDAAVVVVVNLDVKVNLNGQAVPIIARSFRSRFTSRSTTTTTKTLGQADLYPHFQGAVLSEPGGDTEHGLVGR